MSGFMAIALTILIVTEAVVGLESCTAWDTSIYLFGYISFGLASSLLLIRIFAVWRRQFIVVSVSTVLWAIGIALNIHWYTVVMRSVYVQQTGECVRFERSIFSNIGLMISDLGLLAIMLVGVLRHHADMLARPQGFGGVWDLLWHQVIDCLGLDGTVEVPTLVLILLNFHEPWDVTREIVTLGAISMIAIRMYRVLANNQPGTDVDPIHSTEQTLLLR
ncbi:hypothetical protein FA95DRAFT_1613451 [Auriscalpium vulgare]|uniref:Uncharacterized protein n=1 Tax=Auriscalpium vulgare TaxID=40419 RepID=A0ACB8R2V5_9AGAM|nr:hypothetical protein FA95DRAFT_1613451 [Auriscalpium vulgare]